MRDAKLKRGAMIGLMLVMFASQGRANDSSSVLAAGGLVMVKTEAISMQREDLSISPREVRVRYEMRNDKDTPVTLRVAFPLPELPVDSPGGMDISGQDGRVIGHNIDLPFIERPNFLAFRAWADGKSLEPDVEVRALLPDGRDVAAPLREIGGWRLVLYPMLYINDPPPSSGAAEYDIGPTMLRSLRALGAVKLADGDENSAWPLWRTYITFHWLQTFKPGVTIIEHRYRPVAGSFLFRRENDTWVGGAVGDPENLNEAYCIDKTMSDQLQKLTPPNGYSSAMSLAYILTTGANWAGPIGTFHLSIDGTKTPFSWPVVQAVSLCSEIPLERTGPLTLEGTFQNYVPKSDLRVLMVTKLPN